MVSNWFSSISRSRCGNSSVIDALRRQQMRHAGDEVVEVGHLRQHVVADDEIGVPAFGDQLRRQARTPKNSTSVGMPFSIATLATLAAGSMPSTGTPSGRKCCSR